MGSFISEVIKDMIIYFDSDVRRINHALKVHSFAKCIGDLEGISEEKQTILEVAAVLHDIGIKESERKYGSSSAKYQQIEGPPVALKILKKYNLMDEFINRVSFLIGNHHTHNKIDDIDFQILIEADFIVNIFEDGAEKKQIEMTIQKFFKTPSAVQIAKSMYLK